MSWREETGSWFIQSLSEVFEEKSKEWDLLQMLTYVCKKVAIKYESKTIDESTNKTKSIPQIVSTLTKFLKFNVKSIKNKDATCNKNKDSKCNKTKHSSVVSYRLYMLVLYKFLFHYLCMKYSN